MKILEEKDSSIISNKSLLESSCKRESLDLTSNHTSKRL